MLSESQQTVVEDNPAVSYCNTRNWRVLNLAEAQLPEVRAVFSTRLDHYVAETTLHRHTDCFELGICLRGALLLNSNGRQYRIMPGDLFLNKPNDVHCLGSYPKGTLVYGMLFRNPLKGRGFLRLLPSETRDLSARLNSFPCHIAANTTAVKQAFTHLFTCYDLPPGPYRTFCLATACASLLMAVIDAASQKSPVVHTRRMEQVIAVLRTHPERAFNLEDLAREAGRSPSLFAANFKQMTGLPPHQFLLACRLEEAKRRLAASATPITRIAQDLGFCAPQHFTGHFKSAFGLTPRAWRKKASAAK